MWAQYKKTFVRIQLVILLVTCAVAFAAGRVPEALVFFAVMQLGSILGAMWGVRLQARIEVAR